MELREGMVVILRDNYWLLLYQISSSPTILRNEFLLAHALAIILEFSCKLQRDTCFVCGKAENCSRLLWQVLILPLNL